MSYFVYIHICPNNKRYVGITKREPKKRWANGNGYKKNAHFTRAIEKYGWDNISHQVIEVDTESEMFYLEKYLIAFYNSNNPEFGYNNSLGGESGTYGVHPSKETREKMSVANSGIRNGFYGKHHSDETKAYISSIQKGRPSPKKGKPSGQIPWNKGLKGLDAWNKDIPMREESKIKLSKTLKDMYSNGYQSPNKGKPKEKLKWMTPDGDIICMCKCKVARWHKDWIEYKENKVEE